MKPQQTAVLFSFVLSCVTALPSLSAPDLALKDQLPRDITQLITKPDDVLDQVHGLPNDMKLVLTGTPELYDRMLTAGAKEAYNGYMSDVTTTHSNAILGSVLGYRKELASRELNSADKARRLEIYHDSLYSRLVDLQKEFPEDFAQKGASTRNYLQSLLSSRLRDLQRSSVIPMGHKEDVAQWLAEAKKLQAARGPAVRQRLLATSKVLPPAFHLDNYNYVSKAEVLDKLRASGAEPHPLLVKPPASKFSQLPTSEETAATEAAHEQKPSAENKPGKVYVTEDHLKQSINSVNQNKAASNKLPASVATNGESTKTGTPVSVSA